ncbi:MAG: cysteine synthase family protein [Saprospiraceae bacterium]|nr:cysteine synthase family protein [Saprospiraceae bacterium]
MLVQSLNKSRLLEKVQELSKFIGSTPLYQIQNIWDNPKVKIYAKLEWQQLGGSVKARPAFQIIKQAIEEGYLDEQRHLLDASSGNTGIAYAQIGAALGIPVTLVIPQNASKERKQILEALGATIIYTSPFGSTDEAQEKALELARANPDQYFYADQYTNAANWRAHYESTALEIWTETQGEVSHFITGLGTTGTFVGTSKRLLELNPSIQTIALHPETALHGLEGWKHLETAKIPKIYDANMATQNQEVSTLAAYEMIQLASKKEGLLLSPSAAANLQGAIALAENLEEGVVVTIFPDDASKYSDLYKQLFC